MPAKAFERLREDRARRGEVDPRLAARSQLWAPPLCALATIAGPPVSLDPGGLIDICPATSREFEGASEKGGIDALNVSHPVGSVGCALMMRACFPAGARAVLGPGTDGAVSR